MFGRNEMKVCYTGSCLKGREGGFTEYEGRTASSCTTVLLQLLPVEGTRGVWVPCGPTGEVGAT